MEQTQNKKQLPAFWAHLFALFSVIVWGSCYVLTNNLLSAGFTAVQIAPIRMSLAYVALLVMRPKFVRLPWKDELMFVLLGVTGGSLYFYFQNNALDLSEQSASVSIIISLTPIFTMILARLFRRSDETLGRLVWIGSAIAVAGVVLVILNSSLNFHLSPTGDLLALCAGLSWAVYSILMKPYAKSMDSFVVTRRVMFWAFVTAVPLMLVTDGMPDLAPLFTQTNVLLSWIFLAVLGNAVCFALWNIAFERLGVVVTNNYLYASPFVTVLVGWILMGETPHWMSILGAVLITAGVFLAQRDSH
ncbi:MAG: DMT family transporter [Clostridia bacterium]|nr:DMT family transporter [Clostridia bacterium]